jgi:hypothetical protein
MAGHCVRFTATTKKAGAKKVTNTARDTFMAAVKKKALRLGKGFLAFSNYTEVRFINQISQKLDL